MRVAIIGAGVSGLTCAHELENHGIYPDIFEQRSRSGELFSHVAGILQLMNRPVPNQLQWLKKRYHIEIKPLAHWEKITMNSPGVKRVVKAGHLGYFLERGQGPGSLETQLSKSLKTNIYYNVKANYAELAKEYDYVVVATGTRQVPATLGIWKNIFTSMVRGAIVQGNFNTKELVMWLDTDYALGAYAYLTAFSPNRGSLVLIHANAAAEEMERHWTTFIKKEKLDFHFEEHFMLEHISGTVYPHQLGNIILVGSAGGFMESFLGFGTVSAIRSGFHAAQAIAKRKPFAKQVQHLDLEMRRAVRIREILNTFSNDDYNALLKLGTFPIIRQVNYHSNFPVLQFAGTILEGVRHYIDWTKKSKLPPLPGKDKKKGIE